MKQHYYQIVPECYGDTLLVEILGFSRPNHRLGIHPAFKELTENLARRRAVGILDGDKKQPIGLDKFNPSGELHGIKRLSKDNHTILVLCPAFEDWVYKNADAVNIDPANFGFRSREGFRKISKGQDVKHNQNFKQFLNTLKQKSAPGFVQLFEWICEATGIDKSELK